MALAVINAVLAISIVRTFFQYAFLIIKNANPVMLLFAPKIFAWYHSLSSFLLIKLNDIFFYLPSSVYTRSTYRMQNQI